MKDEASRPKENYPLASSSSRMSKTPSWVMLGFILGALFVYAMMRPDRAAGPSTVRVQWVEAPKPATPREPPQLMEIEAVFAAWGEHAVWSDDLTEVVFWNKREQAFSDVYEVRRSGETFYFRTIPKLTRRVILHGKELPDSPLQFTETEEQYQEWRQHGRTERRVERDLRPGRNPPQGIAPPKMAPLTPPPPPPLEPVIGLTPKVKQ